MPQVPLHVALQVPAPSGQDWQVWAQQLVGFLRLKLDQLDRENDLILKDNGSPEGRVRANIGAIYQRLDGGAGSTFYVKESGADTMTGWVAK